MKNKKDGCKADRLESHKEYCKGQIMSILGDYKPHTKDELKALCGTDERTIKRAIQQNGIQGEQIILERNMRKQNETWSEYIQRLREDYMRDDEAGREIIAEFNNLVRNYELKIAQLVDGKDEALSTAMNHYLPLSEHLAGVLDAMNKEMSL